MPDDAQSEPRDSPDEVAPGTPHEDLRGWVPSLATPEEVRFALNKAFDYRGDVTITLKDGSGLEGYVFDRRDDGRSLEDCVARVLPRDGHERVSVRYSDIARLEFSNLDPAADKSFKHQGEKFLKQERPE